MRAIEFLSRPMPDQPGGGVSVSVQPDDLISVKSFLRWFVTTGEPFRVRIASIAKKRSTGKFSQNAHINGHIQDIAVETGCSFHAVKERMKELALSRGYPFDTFPDGLIMPRSESEITSEQAAMLIDTIHQFADEYSITLNEGYDEAAE